jgi:hypothetical protein
LSSLHSITTLVIDPPPAYLFELSEAGIAFSHHGQTGFQELEPGTIVASPVEDNLKRPDAVLAAIDRIAPLNGAKRVTGAKKADGSMKGKRRGADVKLSEYDTRVRLGSGQCIQQFEHGHLRYTRRSAYADDTSEDAIQSRR